MKSCKSPIVDSAPQYAEDDYGNNDYDDNYVDNDDVSIACSAMCIF